MYTKFAVKIFINKVHVHVFTSILRIENYEFVPDAAMGTVIVRAVSTDVVLIQWMFDLDQDNNAQLTTLADQVMTSPSRV